jgi:hypothetical protein
LMIALDVLLNCALEAWEVIDKVREALMAYEVDVPLVKLLQHPQVHVRPAILVATDVSVHDVDLQHTHG